MIFVTIVIILAKVITYSRLVSEFFCNKKCYLLQSMLNVDKIDRLNYLYAVSGVAVEFDSPDKMAKSSPMEEIG